MRGAAAIFLFETAVKAVVFLEAAFCFFFLGALFFAGAFLETCR